MQNRFIKYFLFQLGLWLSCPGASSFPSVESSPKAETLDHSLLDSILKEAVSKGRVDYAIIVNRYPDLQSYLRSLQAIAIDELPKNGRIALLVNAYNAAVLAGVVESGSVESVREVPQFFSKPRLVIGGETTSLERVVEERLRPLGEPRAHFALVNASSSGPHLRKTAYRGETLEADLEDQTRRFIRDPSKNRLDQDSGTFQLNKLFQWRRDDFTRDHPSVLSFIRPYLREADAAYLEETEGRVRVEYLPYDWRLNGGYSRNEGFPR